MACAITSGRKVPCKSAFGGIKKIYFCNFGDIASTTIDGDQTISAIAMTGSTLFFQYDVKGNSSLTTTITSSRDNGTTFYTQTLALTLPYLDGLDWWYYRNWCCCWRLIRIYFDNGRNGRSFPLLY